MSPRKRKDKIDKARKKAASQAEEEAQKNLTGEAPIETSADREPELLTPADLEELKKKADERDEYLDRFQRSVADFSNYQKRAQREADDTRKYAAGPMALNLLEVLDNFQRALSAAQGNIEEDYLKGFEMIAEQILSVLEKHGITPFDVEGKPFDPNFHDALFSVEDQELPDNSIMEELQKGYMQYDRLLRPARVKVSKRPAPIKEVKDEEAQDEPLPESEPSPDRG